MKTYLGLVLLSAFYSASCQAVNAYDLGQNALSSREGKVFEDKVARAVIRPALLECLPRTAKPQPGIITIIIKIASSGEASSVQVTPKSAANRCIEKLLRKGAFPIPPKPPIGEALFPFSARINIH